MKKDLKKQSSTLISCMAFIVLLMLICFFGFNNSKETYSAAYCPNGYYQASDGQCYSYTDNCTASGTTSFQRLVACGNIPTSNNSDGTNPTLTSSAKQMISQGYLNGTFSIDIKKYTLIQNESDIIGCYRDDTLDGLRSTYCPNAPYAYYCNVSCSLSSNKVIYFNYYLDDAKTTRLDTKSGTLTSSNNYMVSAPLLKYEDYKTQIDNYTTKKTFRGWRQEGMTCSSILTRGPQLNSDQNFYACWDESEYIINVNYYLDDAKTNKLTTISGTATVANQHTISASLLKYEDYKTQIDNYTTKKTFRGWRQEGLTCSSILTRGPQIMSDTNLYACWEAKYACYMGCPTINGAKSYQWANMLSSANSECSGTVANITTEQDCDALNQATNTYTATFKDGTTTLGTKTCTETTPGAGCKPATIANPTKTNFTFNGWSNQSSCSTKVTPGTIKTDTTYYACWTGIEKPQSNNTYTATFKDETTTIGVQTCTETTPGAGCKPTTIANPTKTGYTFKGWGLSQAACPSTTTPGTIKTNTTYYACWTKNEEPQSNNTYTATFKDETTTLGTKTCTETTPGAGCKPATIANPTKTGYTFKGWGLSQAACPSTTTPGTIKTNTTYYACWTKNEVIPSCKYTSQTTCEEDYEGYNCKKDSNNCWVQGDKKNIIDNPKTGTSMIAIVWIIGIAMIGYSAWYFTRSKQHN